MLWQLILLPAMYKTDSFTHKLFLKSHSHFPFLPWVTSSMSGLVTESLPPKSELHSDLKSSILLGISSEVALMPLKTTKTTKKQKINYKKNKITTQKVWGLDKCTYSQIFCVSCLVIISLTVLLLKYIYPDLYNIIRITIW